MFVIKRSGVQEQICFDKVYNRISKLSTNLDIDIIKVTKKVISGLYPGVHTTELDVLASEISAQLITENPDYGILASRIYISSLHKETPSKFSKYIEECIDEFNETFITNVDLNKDLLDNMIINDNDYHFSYFALKTLEKSYLVRKNTKVIERPQYMLMRVSVALHGTNIEKIKETYTLMSNKYFIHATPTMFNAGKKHQQLSSCFITQIHDDSIDGIFTTIKNCALMSKSSGGIGLSVSNVRASGSSISGGGVSSGLVPMIRVLNNVARYVDQGGNKRPGAIAVYLEPWHRDVLSFLDLRKNNGKDELRARDIFTALWIPDLFMYRVKHNLDWSLFCPKDAPGLDEVWGTKFEELYNLYENTKPCTKIPAQKLWNAIITSQIETGTPYMLYKDACNRTSNHNHLGTIKASNLCTEIVEYFDKDHTAVCNLASIGLPAFVNNNEFNFKSLYDVTKVITNNLNNGIDINTYPIPETQLSNSKNRPIGIGVQGLADVFILLDIPFDSNEAREVNKKIFETIYFAALSESNSLAKIHGTYDTYNGSRVSNNLLHFDNNINVKHSGLWDWDKLREQIKLYGLRNSLLISPMPTASTSQILGYNECIEPYTSNLYVRRVNSGEFQVVNTRLVNKLKSLGLWNETVKNTILLNNGSIKNVPNIPNNIKNIFKTVWEISQKVIIDMSADRQLYIDQSQSLNIHIEDPTFQKLTSMHFYGWEKGLKTGMYYLRTRPAARSIQFTVDTSNTTTITESETQQGNSCDIGCISCSS